jgi:hypothetical protein
VSNAGWITVTSGSSGTGIGSVGLAVTANPSTSVRTGTLTIAGQTVTVTQAGAACTYTLSTIALSVASAAGAASVEVTAGSGCAWHSVSSSGWITVISGSSGSSDGTVVLAVTANTSSVARTGTVAIAGRTVTVTQAGAPCTFTLTTSAVSIGSNAGTASVGISGVAGCTWNAVSSADWITITGGSSGTGNGTMTLGVTANATSAARMATLTVAGGTLTVTQAAASCTFTLSTTAVSLGARDGDASIAVTVAAGCAWTATSNAAWLRVSGGSSGTGNGSVIVSVTDNPDSSTRSATATVAGQPVAVTQAGTTPLSVTSLKASAAFPSPAGTPISWTAAVTGGTGPYTYCFWLYNGTTWAQMRGWSTSNTWTWEPARAGSYLVQVWVRNAGSSGTNAALQAAASISTPRVLTITAVTPNPTSTAAGQPVTWTAIALGGKAPYSYQFWVYDGAQWQVGRNWSTSASWVWTPARPGSYTFQVRARNSRSTTASAFRSFGPYTATRPSALTATAMTSDLTTPTPARTPITWTAVAAGGTGPYTYQFWIAKGRTWSIGQDWSTSPTWTWIPPATGTYAFQVWVRNAGSVATYDAWRSAGPYVIKTAKALTVSGIAADRTSPVPQGTPVTWSASAVGGTGPYTFKYFVYDGVSWSVGRDWSATPTWTWVPQAPGTYSFQVWARNARSGSTYDAFRSAGPVTIGSPAPLAVTALGTSPLAPLVTDAPVVITAAATGGSGPYALAFWVSDGSSWSLGQSWSASRTFTWTPPAPGTYAVQVRVRNAAAAAAEEAWSELGPFDVVP